jgi:hypothetical protein
MEVSCHFSPLALYLRERNPGTHSVQPGWAPEPLPGLRRRQKYLAFVGNGNPDRPARNPVAISMTLSRLASYRVKIFRLAENGTPDRPVRGRVTISTASSELPSYGVKTFCELMRAYMESHEIKIGFFNVAVLIPSL